MHVVQSLILCSGNVVRGAVTTRLVARPRASARGTRKKAGEEKSKTVNLELKEARSPSSHSTTSL